MIIHKLTTEEFVEKIEKELGFSFARLSDGGFFCIWGRKGYNCDGVEYTQKQADSLISVIKDTTITHGITSIALFAAKAEEWLTQNNLDDIGWYDADVLNKASDEGNLWPFVACIRERKVIMVGPTHLRNFRGFDLRYFVQCHGSKAFEEVDELEAEIAYRVESKQADTVLLSCGQGAAPVLVSRLHKLFPEIVVLDCGSIFDPYVHIFSRSGHKRRGWDEYKRLGRLNFKMNIEDW